VVALFLFGEIVFAFRSGKYYIIGRKEKTKMGRRFEIALEYDGEDPVRNTFLCEIDDLNYSVLRDYDDLYYIKKKYPHKEYSVETEEMSEDYLRSCWGIKEIAEHIESIKKKLESDTELKDFEKEELDEVISDLQSLHDIAMEKCKENNINPENLYINWWINY
jgi:Na+/phosphate symporter